MDNTDQKTQFCNAKLPPKEFANGLLMGKILAAAPAAIQIHIDSNNKPYLAGILEEIDKAIRAPARTITRTKLKDKGCVQLVNIDYKTAYFQITKCLK